MHVARKRIFVGNLPPYVLENEIKEKFSSYGNVVSIEIKHRKDTVNDNISAVFAFVSVEIDDRSLQQCFHEVSNYDWQGYYVKLELAKESFLERLKREREEAGIHHNNTQQNETVRSEPVEKSTVSTNHVQLNNKRVYHSSSESEETITIKKASKLSKDTTSTESSSDSEDEPKQVVVATAAAASTKTPLKLKSNRSSSDDSSSVSDDDIKLVIKNNKNRVQLNGKLKIESVHLRPIEVKPKTSEPPRNEKSLASEEKRKKSLLDMKNSYNQQKTAIKNALSRIDTNPRNKIIFDENDEYNNAKKRKSTEDTYNNANKRNKLSLFGEDNQDDEEEDNNINFDVRKQFEGKRGQKLLELQSRFTNDKRFTLDSRFLDDQPPNETVEENEKEKQFEILESVLGSTLKKRRNYEEQYANTPNTMLRFDPSKPEHSKYELKRAEDDESTDNKKLNRKEKERKEEAKIDEPQQIEVSKETFYKVTDNLKQSLQAEQSFSLLNMFGRAEDTPAAHDDVTEAIQPNKYETGRNPFKYDSSDTEDEGTEEPKHKLNIEKPKEIVNTWREHFFFSANDKRLQEGLDFLKKLTGQTKESFSDTRRELRQIIRSKVRNNQRNNRPFRKKLGRNKMIKVRNAKKR